LRFVLVVDPLNKTRTEVFFSTDIHLSARQIVDYFVSRWCLEVTFAESRTHLGVETQRQWSDKAIARTTPLLMGLFSVVTLMALKLRETCPLKVMSTAWYPKGNNATFSDVMAFVRRAIGSHKYFSKSATIADSLKITGNDLNLLINQLVSSG
jgi:hypothetical protein